MHLSPFDDAHRATSDPRARREQAEYTHRFTPIHDGFCRCRVCKPPLVGQTTRRWWWLDILLVLIVAVIAGIAFL